MSDKTNIEWTDATWNPVTGCSKVSAGCKHCYAERDWARLSANVATRYYGRAFTDVECHRGVLDTPLRWKRPRRIFVNSMSDLFHEDVPYEFLDEVFDVMARAPQHVFQVLTKRPERMLAYLVGAEATIRDMVKYEPAAYTMQWPLSNVWLGVSVEDQATADERIPLLLRTPAAVRWISAEPLLGPIDLNAVALLGTTFSAIVRGGEDSRVKGIDWVVVGGESGPKARPMHPNWVRSVRDQCAAASVPFLFKQWGEWAPLADHPEFDLHGIVKTPLPDGMGPSNAAATNHVWLAKVGKKSAGRLLDRVEHNGYPA